MAVTWTLKDGAGGSLSHQAGAGSPLALKFTNSGDVHLSGYATELIAVIECVASSSPVAIELTPDNSGYTLDQSASTPTKAPATHGGGLTWVNGENGLTTLYLTVPPTGGGEYGWELGQGEPTIALRATIKVNRE